MKLKNTPIGEFSYPFITRPAPAFKNGKPSFKVDLILSGKDADKLKKEIDVFVEEAVKEAEAKVKEKYPKIKKIDSELLEKVAGTKRIPYYEERDEDTGELTGRTIFRFKHTPKKDSTFTPFVVDSNGDVITNTKGLFIGSGTKGRVGYSIKPYFMEGNAHGVSLDLGAVQIIELVSGSSSLQSVESLSHEVYGFSSEKGSFVGKQEEEQENEEEEETEEGKEDYNF